MKKLMYVCVVLLLSCKTTFAQWQEMPQSTTLNFPDDIINFGNDTLIVISNDQIIRSIDGAMTWQVAYQSSSLRSLFRLNDSTAFALSQPPNTSLPASIIKTTDKGVTWNFTSFPNISQFLKKIWFLDDNVGFMLGNLIHRTTDGGQSWLPVTSTPRQYEDLVFSNIARGFAGGTTGSLALIAFTTNGGSNWFSHTPANSCCYEIIKEIKFIGNEIGYAVGNGSSVNSINFSRTYKTTNGGTSWLKIDSADNIRSETIFFTSADTGYTVRRYSNTSEILKTTNGAFNWYPQHSGSGYLKKIIFTSKNIGYAIGTKFPNGTVSSQVPVIYKTTNGGGTVTSISEPLINKDQQFLLEVYPNPAEDLLYVHYNLPEMQNVVMLTLHNSMGQVVRWIQQESHVPAGEYTVSVGLQNHPSGIYYCTLRTEKNRKTIKTVVR